MNWIRPLIPGFLKKAEHKLLLKRPGIWSARAHLVLYYGLLFMMVLAVICFLDPADIRSASPSPYWIGYVSIISVIGITVWLIYLLRFNLFKKYGILHPLYHIIAFILLFISTGIIVLFTYVHPAVESVRANMAFGDEELVNDANSFNLKICQLEYDSLRGDWNYDNIAVSSVGYYPGQTTHLQGGRFIPDTVQRLPVYEFNLVDSSRFYDLLKGSDSVAKINDSLYRMYNTPLFAFVSPYNADNYTKEKLLTNFNIYHRVLQNRAAKLDTVKMRKEFDGLLQKYRNKEGYTYNEFRDDYNRDKFTKIKLKYDTYTVDQSFSNLVQKKYMWSEAWPIWLRMFYYITLAVTLLIFIFRQSTTRTFFLSLLAALLLTIFTALVMSYSSNGDTAFFAWMIVYTIVFFLGSLTTWFMKKRNVFTGISINLFVYIVSILPLLLMAWYISWYEHQPHPDFVNQHFENKKAYFFYSEIASGVLLVILLATYISKVYRRWYALPEE